MKTFNEYHNHLEEQKALMKPLLKFTKKYIKARDFITLSSFPDVQTPFKKYAQIGRGAGFEARKPEGIWFGIGNSWIEWLEYNMPQWAHPSVMKLDINLSKIFHICKDKDLEVFNKKYAFKDPGTGMWMGDWKALAQDHDWRVHWKFPKNVSMLSDSPLSLWYGWDVRSGVVWNPASIKKMQIIGRYDEDKKEHVPT